MRDPFRRLSRDGRPNDEIRAPSQAETPPGTFWSRGQGDQETRHRKTREFRDRTGVIISAWSARDMRFPVLFCRFPVADHMVLPTDLGPAFDFQ